jgi:hypothetical protein
VKVLGAMYGLSQKNPCLIREICGLLLSAASVCTPLFPYGSRQDGVL